MLIDAGVGEPRHLADIERAARGAARASRSRARHARPRGSRVGRAGVSRGASGARVRQVSVAGGGRALPGGVAAARRRRRRIARRGATTRSSCCTRPDIRPITSRSGTSRARTAFTGDLVVAGSSVMIHASRGGDLAEYLAALERLLRARAARAAAGARPAHRRSGGGCIAGYLEHRRMRERQVVARSSGRPRAPCRRSPNPSMMVSTRR